MQRRVFLSRTVLAGLASGATCCLGGCGTLFHSERVGQPHRGDLDWKIVALDSLGLLLFFVPGAVAFVVDFSSGAIYLPCDCHDGCVSYDPGPEPMRLPPPPPSYQPDAVQPLPAIGTPSAPQPPQLQPPLNGAPRVGALREVVIPKSELERRTIERVVSEQLGRPVALNEPAARVSRLVRLDDFFARRQQHRADRDFGLSPKQFFARLPRA